LFIAPPRSTEVFSVTGHVKQPVPRAVSGGVAERERDPLLSHVDVADVGVQQAMRVSLPAWARPVIVGDVGEAGLATRSVPLLWAGEQAGRRIAVLAFDLRRSDLALQVAFPLLLANLTGWLAPSGGSDLPAQVPPGTVVSFSVPPDVQQVRGIGPEGSLAPVTVGAGQAVVTATDLGIYTIRWDEGGLAAFAVNLFSPFESDLAPAGSLSLTAGPDSGGAEPGQDAAHSARREWWRPLAWIALLVLVVEWLVYYRATVVRLWSRARGVLSNALIRR
jgi:hypothetical protein